MRSRGGELPLVAGSPTCLPHAPLSLSCAVGDAPLPFPSVSCAVCRRRNKWQLSLHVMSPSTGRELAHKPTSSAKPVSSPVRYVEVEQGSMARHSRREGVQVCVWHYLMTLSLSFSSLNPPPLG